MPNQPPSSQSSAIFVSGLTKSFGKTMALNNLNLQVNRGEVHGFLGPNGAGKSTTIRILLGLLKKDAGQVSLLGLDPIRHSKKLHQQLAYVPGDVNLWPNVTGGEIIDLITRLRGGINQTLRQQLCRDFDLDTTKKAQTYSKGNRQKVALIAALASEAELYIFDEPTSGLDPLMEAVFQEQIRQLKAQGRTVLLSSHILAQVEVLADRLSIIRQGQRIETGTLQELRHLSDITISVSTQKSLKQLLTSKKIRNAHQSGDICTFEVSQADLPEIMSQLSSLKITNLEVHPPTLEQLMLKHYDNRTPSAAEKS